MWDEIKIRTMYAGAGDIIHPWVKDLANISYSEFLSVVKTTVFNEHTEI